MSFTATGSDSISRWQKFTSIALFLPAERYEKELAGLPEDLSALIKSFSKKNEFTPKAGKSLSFETLDGPRVTLSLLPKNRSAFSLLSWARKQVSHFSEGSKKNSLAWIGDVGPLLTEALLDALATAITVASHKLPTYKSKPDKEKPREVSFAVGGSIEKEAQTWLDHAQAVAEGTNLVRRLAVLPGNYLSPSLYRKEAERLAREEKLKTEWLSHAELKKMGAGAFDAVAKGADDQGSGILKVSYQPKIAKKRVAIVGKGLCFDTGGNNLKTGGHMLGMNEDMTGSAVALAMVITAKRLSLPIGVTSYLAITENVLSPQAFRPNDVVKSLSGKTIEVIDTDAEGRMVLADTLTLAGKGEVDLILDFATLTGACVRAIGTNYSGAYSNRKRLFSVIRKAGFLSGERVWPFPNDADYGKCLKSEVADIKQCRPSGGSDHIEAGFFLRQFVPRKTDWIHIDLSACDHEGGLGAVSTKTTGFGVRFGITLLDRMTRGGSSLSVSK